MGLAQNLEGFNGEAEPRLTSGGEAATLPTKRLFVQSPAALQGDAQKRYNVTTIRSF
jgi:hypothetical protein